MYQIFPFIPPRLNDGNVDDNLLSENKHNLLNGQQMAVSVMDHTALQWHVISRGRFECELAIEPG